MCIDVYCQILVFVGQLFHTHLEVEWLAAKRENMTIDPEVYEEYCKYAGKNGIKSSTWVNLQMKNFIEEEKMLEEIRKKSAHKLGAVLLPKEDIQKEIIKNNKVIIKI